MIVLAGAKVGKCQKTDKGWFRFELDSEGVKYTLATRYQIDQDEWVYSIYAQIQLANVNKEIKNLNKKIIQTEKLVSKGDSQTIYEHKNPEGMMQTVQGRAIIKDYIKREGGEVWVEQLIDPLTIIQLSKGARRVIGGLPQKEVIPISEEEKKRREELKHIELVQARKDLNERIDQMMLGEWNLSFTEELAAFVKERREEVTFEAEMYVRAVDAVKQRWDEIKKDEEVRKRLSKIPTERAKARRGFELQNHLAELLKM